VLAGAEAPNPDLLVAACLRQLQLRYAQLVASGGDAVRSGLAAEYAGRCVTFGSDVRVQLPAGDQLIGRAEGVDELGRLRVTADGNRHLVAAGDVTHVR